MRCVLCGFILIRCEVCIVWVYIDNVLLFIMELAAGREKDASHRMTCKILNNNQTAINMLALSFSFLIHTS